MTKKRKIIPIIAIVLIVIVFGIIIWKSAIVINSVQDETLRWTMIGALGSWAGSIFGAVALLISLFAFWLPQKVKLHVSMSAGMMLSQISGTGKIDIYTVTIRNVGMRAATVTNFYLHLGGRDKGDIFVGMLNQDPLFKSITPQFPVRLDQGEFFEYHLHKDRLDAALAHYEENTPRDTKLFIRVDEVTKGTKYYKTKWILGSFVDHHREPSSEGL